MKKKLFLLGLALTVLIVQNGCVWWNQETVTVGGKTVIVDSSVPANTLDHSNFSLQKDGTIAYSGGHSKTGIDVSAHQGKINWKKVAKKVDFAMLRVGYRGYAKGNLSEDNTFSYNIKQALKYGSQVGVYFFSQAINQKEAKEEANYVLSLIKNYDISMNVAYDWEQIENVDAGEARTEQVTEATVTKCAAAFCDVIRKAGYQPAIYCNGMLGYLNYDLAQLSNVDIWYADYDSTSPDFAYQIRMWQYTKSGKLDGITGNVDFNLYFSDKEKSTVK